MVVCVYREKKGRRRGRERCMQSAFGREINELLIIYFPDGGAIEARTAPKVE